MRTVTIFDKNLNEYICEDIELWEMADALVNSFCDDSTPQEVYDACIACADAYAKGEPVYEYTSYLGIKIN